MAAVVELDRVTVTYGRRAALRNVSVSFPEGAVGLLGPNGAGKSTMLKALLGFVPPQTGRMEVLGLDVRRVDGAIQTADDVEGICGPVRHATPMTLTTTRLRRRPSNSA